MKPGKPPSQSARLLDQVRDRIRYPHYSVSTEQRYVICEFCSMQALPVPCKRKADRDDTAVDGSHGAVRNQK